MDTDVEVVRSLDGFLMHEAFSGFESTRSIPTGIMACRKGYPLFRRLLAEYEKRHFVGSDGAFDLTTNVEAITSAVEKLGFIPNNEFQIVDGFALYPSDWFCPKSYETGLVVRTDNTHAIHHFAGSWLDASEREILRLKHDWMSRFPNMNVKVATMAAKIEYGLKHKDPEPLFLSAKRRLPGFGVAKEAAEKRNA